MRLEAAELETESARKAEESVRRSESGLRHEMTLLVEQHTATCNALREAQAGAAPSVQLIECVRVLSVVGNSRVIYSPTYLPTYLQAGAVHAAAEQARGEGAMAALLGADLDKAQVIAGAAVDAILARGARNWSAPSPMTMIRRRW